MPEGQSKAWKDSDFCLVFFKERNKELSLDVIQKTLNTLRAGLIQAVRKKQLIRTWLCG